MHNMVYWDAHATWMAPMKVKKAKCEGLCNSCESEELHQYMLLYPKVLIAYSIHSSNWHPLRNLLMKSTTQIWRYFTLHKGKKHVKMLLNTTVKLKKDLPFVSKHLVFCFTLLISHFHIRVLISTADKQWKCESDAVLVDQLLSLLKCCTCLCTYRALMICTASNIDSQKKLTAVI